MQIDIDGQQFEFKPLNWSQRAELSRRGFNLMDVSMKIALRAQSGQDTENVFKGEQVDALLEVAYPDDEARITRMGSLKQSQLFMRTMRACIHGDDETKN